VRLNTLDLKSVLEGILPGLADPNDQEDPASCFLNMRKSSVDGEAAIVCQQGFEALFVGIVVLDVVAHGRGQIPLQAGP
jgi:hypothetical protein